MHGVAEVGYKVAPLGLDLAGFQEGGPKAGFEQPLSDQRVQLPRGQQPAALHVRHVGPVMQGKLPGGQTRMIEQQMQHVDGETSYWKLLSTFHA